MFLKISTRKAVSAGHFTLDVYEYVQLPAVHASEHPGLQRAVSAPHVYVHPLLQQRVSVAHPASQLQPLVRQRVSAPRVSVHQPLQQRVLAASEV